MLLKEKTVQEVMDKVVREIEKRGWLSGVGYRAKLQQESYWASWRVELSCLIDGKQVNHKIEVLGNMRVWLDALADVPSDVVFFGRRHVERLAKLLTVLLIARYFEIMAKRILNSVIFYADDVTTTKAVVTLHSPKNGNKIAVVGVGIRGDDLFVKIVRFHGGVGNDVFHGDIGGAVQAFKGLLFELTI